MTGDTCNNKADCCGNFTCSQETKTCEVKEDKYLTCRYDSDCFEGMHCLVGRGEKYSHCQCDEGLKPCDRMPYICC